MTLDTFTRAYIACALWSSSISEDDNRSMDYVYQARDIAPDTLARMVADCVDFQTMNAADLIRAHDDGQTAEQSGHDFWLTRNGHGAGFWDRGLGNVGERLTANAHAYGSCDLYVGDDGLIYGSN